MNPDELLEGNQFLNQNQSVATQEANFMDSKSSKNESNK